MIWARPEGKDSDSYIYKDVSYGETVNLKVNTESTEGTTLTYAWKVQYYQDGTSRLTHE